MKGIMNINQKLITKMGIKMIREFLNEFEPTTAIGKITDKDIEKVVVALYERKK